MINDQLQQQIVNLLIDCEGCKLQAYQNDGDVPTIGIGTTTYPNGERVKLNDTCTTEQAINYCIDYLTKEVYPALEKLNKNIPDQYFIPLCSLFYNVGSSRVGPSIKNAVKQSNWDVLPSLFKMYIHLNGKRNEGLINRRNQEVSFME